MSLKFLKKIEKAASSKNIKEIEDIQADIQIFCLENEKVTSFIQSVAPALGLIKDQAYLTYNEIEVLNKYRNEIVCLQKNLVNYVEKEIAKRIAPYSNVIFPSIHLLIEKLEQLKLEQIHRIFQFESFSIFIIRLQELIITYKDYSIEDLKQLVTQIAKKFPNEVLQEREALQLFIQNLDQKVAPSDDTDFAEKFEELFQKLRITKSTSHSVIIKEIISAIKTEIQLFEGLFNIYYSSILDDLNIVSKSPLPSIDDLRQLSGHTSEHPEVNIFAPHLIKAKSKFDVIAKDPHYPMKEQEERLHHFERFLKELEEHGVFTVDPYAIIEYSPEIRWQTFLKLLSTNGDKDLAEAY